MMAFVSYQENKFLTCLVLPALTMGFNFLDDQHTNFMVMGLIALCPFKSAFNFGVKIQS